MIDVGDDVVGGDCSDKGHCAIFSTHCYSAMDFSISKPFRHNIYSVDCRIPNFIRA